MPHVKYLILGGGITGLSTAYHLQQAGQTDYRVLEKENEPGGLCRSVYKEGFTFDYSGHLLHLHTPQTQKLVRQLLGNNLHRLQRRAWIYTQNSRVPFPFQANLHALPAPLRRACVEGLSALKQTAHTPPKNFEDFCLRSFGRGIYQAFMRPYNTKLWGRTPRELTCEWCGPFVPVPPATHMRQSAAGKSLKRLGYNASFYYPKQGGCGALPYALAARLTHLQLNTPVTQIDLENKMVRAGNESISYDYLVNTLTLVTFIRLLKNKPAFANDSRHLTAQDVTVYQVALQGKTPSFHWVYCPDKQDPFYRVGVQSRFSAANAPKGCYALYVELPGRVRPSSARERQIHRALVQKGIISVNDKTLFSFWQTLPNAYVIYDKYRTAAVTRILQKLQSFHCFCAGRYGRWEYSFIERSLLQGQQLAKQLTTNEVL